MRVIFSRKGFDSAAGGCPSPLIDDRPLSLPIPSSRPTPTTYGTLQGPVAEIVRDLTCGRRDRSKRYSARSYCHLDPDIESGRRKRRPARWRGALGLADSHAIKQGVGAGDLFLFFGLFQPVELHDRWRFQGEKEHRIFGWLQVDAVKFPGSDPRKTLQEYPWLRDHLHVHGHWGDTNAIYIATETLSFRPDLRGWGVFRRGRRLTLPGSRLVSVWRMPEWLNTCTGGTGMSWHPLKWRRQHWRKSGVCRIVSRGQEFVADIAERSDAMEWLARLFEEA